MYERNVGQIEELVRKQNQWRGSTLNLIASENLLSDRARGVMGSDFAHRYAEGHPGERYYQGTEIIDEIESLLKKQLKSLFHCRQVDVRPISGTVANDAVFSRYIPPGDVVMVNSTPAGGHISHHRAGSVGKYTHNIIDFPLTADGYHIDLDRSALLMTASVHKTFFGSQRGIILSNAGEAEWRKIDKGAFPGSSSNHHLDTLVPLAVSVYEMMDFAPAYARQTIANAKELGRRLSEVGFNVQGAAFGFTESHQLALDVREFGGGDEVARHLKDNAIILN